MENSAITPTFSRPPLIKIGGKRSRGSTELGPSKRIREVQTYGLPKGILTKTLQYSGRLSLARCLRVCKEWKECIQDDPLLRLSLRESFFGKAAWERYLGPIGRAPPIPKNITIKSDELLFLVPKEVGGVSLTLNSLGKLIQNPQGRGHAAKYDSYDEDVQREYGDAPVRKSYWALMSKTILSDSPNKTFSEQKKLLNKPDGVVPKVLEAAIGILTHHVQTGKRLCSDYPSITHTRCIEMIDESPVSVGSFGSSGLQICCFEDQDGVEIRHSSDGLCRLRRF